MPMTGPQLRKHRQILGLTQKQMAKELGLHWNFLARAERGECGIGEPAVKLLRLLVKLSKDKR